MRHEERQNARAILAANVEKLIDTLGGGTQMGLVRAIRVPQKTISRAKNDENAANLDTVNDIAQGTGLHPWQLLVPDLDPANPPQLAQLATDAPSGKLKRLTRRGGAVDPRVGAPRPGVKERKITGSD